MRFQKYESFFTLGRKKKQFWSLFATTYCYYKCYNCRNCDSCSKHLNISFLLMIEVNLYTNVALKTFFKFFDKSSDDVTKKVNLH